MELLSAQVDLQKQESAQLQDREKQHRRSALNYCFSEMLPRGLMLMLLALQALWDFVPPKETYAVHCELFKSTISFLATPYALARIPLPPQPY